MKGKRSTATSTTPARSGNSMRSCGRSATPTLGISSSNAPTPIIFPKCSRESMGRSRRERNCSNSMPVRPWSSTTICSISNQRASSTRKESTSRSYSHSISSNSRTRWRKVMSSAFPISESITTSKW